MVTLKTNNKFEKTIGFLNRLDSLKDNNLIKILEEYGKMGVELLRKATPKKTGRTSNSWTYKVEKKENSVYNLTFKNTNIQKGKNIAIMLQYGHATKNGGYIQGIDYINPELEKIITELNDRIRKEMSYA